MRHHVRIRRFLNRADHEAGAYIIAKVPDTATCPTGCEHRIWDGCRDYTVTITDCSRRIVLDFALATAGERRNSLHKINMLIDALEQFRAGLAIESDRLYGRQY